MRRGIESYKTGIECYDDGYRSKIENYLNANKDLGLRGYVNFIHSSSYSTRFAYLNYVCNFLRFTGKNKNDVTLDDYTEYINYIEDKSPSYQIAVYSALKKLSSYMVASGVGKVDYMQYIERPKAAESQITKDKREVAYLNDDELPKYLYNVENGVGNSNARSKQEKWRSRDTLIVQIFLTTGMRCSALFRLDVDSLNLEKGVLFTVDKGGYVQEHSLAPIVIETAKLWIKEREEKGVPKEEKALFVSNRLNRMHLNSIRKVVSKYADDVKGGKFSPHKLRATYGTHLYNKTKDIYLVQQCMGHSSPKTTELYIRGQKNESREKAAGIMESYLKHQ